MFWNSSQQMFGAYVYTQDYEASDFLLLNVCCSVLVTSATSNIRNRRIRLAHKRQGNTRTQSFHPRPAFEIFIIGATKKVPATIRKLRIFR